MSDQHTPHFVRRTFLTGLVILLPLYVTYVLVGFLFGMFAGVGTPVARGLVRLLGSPAWAAPLAPVIALLFALGVIFGLGLVGTNFLGRRLLDTFEGLVMRVPLVSTVYGAVKQMIETFRRPGGSFQRVVLVQYPSKGLWVMGFVASEHPDRLNISPAERLLAVFIPTTPNPTSGFLVLVPPDDVVDVDYTVDEAFKFIVSSGVLGRELSGPRAPAGGDWQQGGSAG